MNISRCAALFVFILTVFGLTAQLTYLINQYFKESLLISSVQYRVDKFQLPVVYVCSILNGYLYKEKF